MVENSDKTKFEIFELGTVDEVVAKFEGTQLLDEIQYEAPIVAMFGEQCPNPDASKSHLLKHPAIYYAKVSEYKMIGGAAFPIIQNKSILHQYFSTDYWETSEQATLCCDIRQDQNLLGYCNIKSHHHYAHRVINLVGNGSYNYAHWMTEYLPQFVLLKKAGVDLSEYKVLVDSRSFPSMLEALFLLGVTDEQLIKVDAMTLNDFPEALWVSPVANVVFQRPHSMSSNASDKLTEPQHASFHPEVLRVTRNIFLDLIVQHEHIDAPEKIFIKRFSGRRYHSRSVINESVIQSKLEAEGFVSVDPSTLTFTEQVKLFSKAQYIVGASGAALLNMLWAPEGAKVIVLMNNSKVANYWYFSNIATAVGHQLSYVLGNIVQTGSWSDIHHADFIIDYHHLCNALNAAGLEVALPIIASIDELSRLSVDDIFQYAELLQRDSFFEQATLAYQAILVKYPEHAEANHNLGIIVAQNIGAAQALPMLEAAITSKPAVEQFWVTYIDALIMSGAMPQVVDALALGLNFGLTPATTEILGQDLFDKFDKDTADHDAKRLLALTINLRHQRLLNTIQKKSKIKVVFFVLHKSVWKLDAVFQAMLNDPFFEPVILVCPYTFYGETIMLAELDATNNYFQLKGYPTINSYDEQRARWVEVDEIAPDVIFFTNPHDITQSSYYDGAYKNYLSCYVPYDHQVSQYDDNQAQYNQYFHNAMWKIFVPHIESKDIFINTSANKGANVYVTGYPACESYINAVSPDKSVWKFQDSCKKKIIWAPHHTIDSPELPYANFLKYADFFQYLVQQYAGKIQWAFKPHPILKSKLYEHPEWGKEKTDDYYAFWENQPNTQFEDGEYQDLFIQSDAMIHDCGSFLAEYLYLKKPVLYLVATANIKNYLNPFGIKAFDACEHAYTKEEIINFIDTFSTISMEKVNLFYQNQIAPYFEADKPSAKIIANIKQGFAH